MDIKYFTLLFQSSLLLAFVRGDMPGTYYWRPRLGIDLAVPTTDRALSVVGPNFKAPSVDGIRAGSIVLIESFGAGMMVVAIASGLSDSSSESSLNLLKPAFYNNAYWWALRYLSEVPHWASGKAGHFALTTKLWPKRFSYKDRFVPEWLTKLLFFIPEKEWQKEREEYRKFKKYSEVAFSKSYRYPNKVFNNFRSEESAENSGKVPPEISQSESEGKFKI